MFDFDQRIGEKFGIKYRNSTLVFIKTGKGGSIVGCDGKYLRMAEHIFNTFGCSVVIASNPIDEKCDLAAEVNTVLQGLKTIDKILYIGLSDGALIGAQHGYEVPLIKRMLLINGPLMINPAKTRRGIERFSGEYIEMVYGTLDPSYRYYSILEAIHSEIFYASKIEGADHRFSGMEDVLVSCIDKFLESGIYTRQEK